MDWRASERGSLIGLTWPMLHLCIPGVRGLLGRVLRVNTVLVVGAGTCYIWDASPRSSADRALASGARGVGSSPTGGTIYHRKDLI